MYLLLACCKVQLVAQSDIPRVRECRCWAIICGFLRRRVRRPAGTRLDAVFPILRRLQRLVDADFAAVEIGFYAQWWSCFSELDVGGRRLCCSYSTGKTNYANHKLELMSHCMTSDWQLKHCDTVCHSLLYGLHLQRAPK